MDTSSMTAADPRDGLPELPESAGRATLKVKPGTYKTAPVYTADQMRAYAEQCLAHARPEAVDEAMVERACIAYYEQPAWAFMSHKAACKDRMRAALVTALTPDQSP